MHAALGDIKKMFKYAITCVNMGDRPARCIAQVAMRETAKLPIFAHRLEQRRILEEDSYIDGMLTSHNSLVELNKITEGVEEILSMACFLLKPWVRSGNSGRWRRNDDDYQVEDSTIILANQLRSEDNKALGVGYTWRRQILYTDSYQLFQE